jgi:hypothetical protein
VLSLCVGRCLHGNTTNNVAEIFNCMGMTIREQDSPYKSLLAAIQLLEERQAHLQVHVIRAKTCNASSAWTPLSLVPHVQAEHDRLAEHSAELPKPQVFEDGDGRNCFRVQSAARQNPKQMSYTVRPFEFQAGAYERACTCGGNASSSTMCVHMKKVLRSTTSMWHTFVKPWQTPSAWEKQVGQRVEPIDPIEQVIAAEKLYQAGQLLPLEVPNLAIHGKGRPTNTPNKEEQERVKSFMEEVRLKGGASIAAAGHVIAGSAFRNKGGKGTGKSCIRCRLAGVSYHAL